MPSPSHRCMDLSSERKEDTGWEINLKLKIAGEAVKTGKTHTHTSQRERSKRQEGREL